MKKVGDTPELLENFSERDQECFQPIFNYDVGRRITGFEIYAIRNHATDAKFSLTWETWKQTNIILRLKTKDGYEGVSCVTSFDVHEFNENHLKDLEKAIVVMISIQSIDPLVVSQRLESMIPDIGDLTKSSIDIALWDIAAKRADCTLADFLGAQRNKIDAYASLPCYQSIDLYLKNINYYVAQGYKTLKLHVWGSINKDKRLINIINEKFKGTSVRFMLDFEGVYNFHDALKLGQLMDKELFICIEAPIEDDLFDDYRKLKNALPITIIPDGFDLYSIDHLETGILKQSWDAGRFDASIIGGVTEALKLLIVANKANLPIELQCWGHGLVQLVNLHIILANKNSKFFEVPTPIDVYEFAMKDVILINKGFVYAPKQSGLGVNIDWDILLTADYCKQITRGFS